MRRTCFSSSYAASDAPDFIDATLDVDVNNYLPDDLLVKVDIATMAHGLEARSPLLDHPLMEFAASLPSGMKLNGGIKKHILKEAVQTAAAARDPRSSQNGVRRAARSLVPRTS